MALTHEKRLERFIRQQAFGSHDSPLEQFLFYHAPAGGKGKQIWDRRIESPITEAEIDPMISEFMEILESDAKGMGGMQRYQIEARREGTNASSGRFVAKIYGEADEEDIDADPLDHEGPTSRGLVAQSMRHTEAMTKTLMGSLGVVMGTLQRTLAQQTEVNERLINQRFESLEIIEEAMTKRHERELEAMVVTAEQDRKDKFGEMIRGLAPVAVNKLAGGGRKLLPEKTTPREEMINHILDTLDPDQAAKLQSILRPEQLIIMFELFAARQAESEAKGEKTSGKSSNGES